MSKAKQAEYMKEYRQRLKASVIPKVTIDKTPTVIPNVIPNPWLAGHLRVCPDYDVNNPGDHFKHCPYINPQARFQPKLCWTCNLATLYPTGALRCDLSKFQPNQCTNRIAGKARLPHA